MDKWNRVTKDFPPPGKRVLVWNGYDVSEAVRVPKSRRWNGRLQWRSGMFWLQGVSHWMPKPKPPAKRKAKKESISQKGTK